MKTTFVLLAALLVNTFMIFSDSLLALVQFIHPLFLLVIEVVLLIVFAIHKFLVDFSKTMKTNFGGLDFLPRKREKE